MILFCMLIVSSCSENLVPSHISEECPLLAGLRILDDDEKAQLCNYDNVYRYQGEIYTKAYCCLCDEPLPVNCEGEILCGGMVECLGDFASQAEYLFSVVKE